MCQMTVYAVTMVGVYDHGSAGIFTNKDNAEAHAKRLYEDSDQYHDFRIDEIELNVPLYPWGRRPNWPKKDPLLVAGQHIEFVGLDPQPTKDREGTLTKENK